MTPFDTALLRDFGCSRRVRNMIGRAPKVGADG